MKWPPWPVISLRDRLAVLRTLEGGYWWYGARTRAFEAEFAAFQGARCCITCSSGTTALEICLQALGIGPGDEVVVPAFTFFATASSVVRLGASPIFVDVDASWCIDPEKLQEVITERTKAIIPVHFGGRVADMDAVTGIARRHGLHVIEDACHSWGSQWRGAGTGTLGDAGAFSFQFSKNITAGEGGAIVTNNHELAETCRMIANLGMRPGTAHVHHYIGTNARITEFQAALLSAQLTRLPGQMERREQNAKFLDERLANIPGIALQLGDERITRRSYHCYCLQLDPEAFGCSREVVLRAVAAEGLPLLPVYPMPLYCQPVFQNREGAKRADAATVAEDLCLRSGCYLPHWVLLADERDLQDVVAIFEKVQRNAKNLRGE